MNDENRTVTDAIERCIPSIEKVTAAVVQAFEKGGRLIYLGAGTSGRLGVLDASECPPTFGVSPDMVVGVIAGGDYALRHAIEGAEDDETIAQEQLKKLALVKEDVVVGISASGRTPYVVAGLSYAKEVGCFTGAISNSPDALISKVASVGIEAITGPEVVTGSTRMKAGTAQKIILNMITTTAMIQVGKILAICSKNRCTGPLWAALFSFLFCFAKSTAPTSSTLPSSIPVNSANSRPTSVTLPGPKTI